MSTYTSLTYHTVFSTKYRKRRIDESLREDLYSYIGGIIRGEKGSLLEIGGVEDHIHLLTGFSPTTTVSDVLKLIKGKSRPNGSMRKERRRVDSDGKPVTEPLR